MLEGEGYQIVSVAIANRVALEGRDFVCIAGPEKRENAANLRGEKPKFSDLVANTGEDEYGDSDRAEILLIRQRMIAGQENFEACLRGGAKQDAVAQAIPLLTAHCGDIMVRKFQR